MSIAFFPPDFELLAQLAPYLDSNELLACSTSCKASRRVICRTAAFKGID